VPQKKKKKKNPQICDHGPGSAPAKKPMTLSKKKVIKAKMDWGMWPK
jgi:hypothetical protein